MMAKKHRATTTARIPAEVASPEGGAKRRPWKKKTPVEVVLDQIDKVREQVAEQEEVLNQSKRQLAKLEEVRKVLEAS